MSLPHIRLRSVTRILVTCLVGLVAAGAVAADRGATAAERAAAVAEGKPTPQRKRAAKPRAAAPRGHLIAAHLERAVAIDAQSASLDAQRRAVSARYATSNSITPGSPYFAGARQDRVSGNVKGYRETELEVGMPLWLPGQRDAFERDVTAGVLELEERLALRRLDVAALLRDAWWRAQRAERDAAIARDRLATARDIGHDMTRRVELGESSSQDELLARNETLAAETEVAQKNAAAEAARAAYRVLTAGALPDGTLELALPPRPAEDHPALRAPLATVAKAETRLRLVDASFIESPEIGVFGRNEQGTEPVVTGDVPVKSNNNTLGVRFRLPLPTPGRNEPRIAEARAEMDSARAELDRAQRLVSAEIAAERLKVATEQFDLARKSFRLGEINAFDLYRVRQLQLDAQRSRADAAIDLGVAQSRLNQAWGYAP